MNLEKIEKQLYSDKFLDEKNNYIYASLSNKIGGLIGSVKGLVLLSVYEDILYIETAPVPHKLIAHTKLNLVEFYGKIAEVAKLDDIFFQTHRSFVVNISNVASVDRTANMVFFEGDESCLLSRTRKKEFLERLKNR